MTASYLGRLETSAHTAPSTHCKDASVYNIYHVCKKNTVKALNIEFHMIQQLLFWVYTLIYPKELEAGTGTDICTLRFIAALFTIVKRWKPPTCPLMDEWIKKM